MTDEPSANPPSDASIELAPPAWIAPNDLRFTFTRSQGPGGQSVNKVSSAAILRVAVTAIRDLPAGAAERLRTLAGRRLTRDDEIVIRAEVHRSQNDNRRACVERLRGLVSRALKPPTVRKKKRPTRAMIERRLAAKRQQAQKKRERRRESGED